MTVDTKPKTAAVRGDDAIKGRRARNLNGQAMGPKGRQTRHRLIDATVKLLEATRLRDLYVADIARAAGTSPATFYVYFPDVPDVVLAALDELTQSTPELLAIIDEDWSKGDPKARTHAIVEYYLDFWAAHRALFRVRNLAADEGDERFLHAREQATRSMRQSIADAVLRAQEAGWVSRSLDPRATSAVLISMLERFAAVQFHYRYAEEEREQMTNSAAYILAHLMAPPGKDE